LSGKRLNLSNTKMKIAKELPVVEVMEYDADLLNPKCYPEKVETFNQGLINAIQSLIKNASEKNG
jgi:hypothetical protein